MKTFCALPPTEDGRSGAEIVWEGRSNIVLIGMPGAGKSTVGVILAKLTSRDFIDTDVISQLPPYLSCPKSV
jgi:ABC-type transport system involved in cytochrome bd biosynthesis fused ATPase/permease subunit